MPMAVRYMVASSVHCCNQGLNMAGTQPPPLLLPAAAAHVNDMRAAT